MPAGVCPRCESLAYLATPEELAKQKQLAEALPSKVRIVLDVEIPAVAKHIMAYRNENNFSPEYFTPERLANLFISRYVLRRDDAPEFHECFKTWKITSHIDKVAREQALEKQVITQDTDGSGLMKNKNDTELPPSSVATKEEVTELIKTLENNIITRMKALPTEQQAEYAKAMQRLLADKEIKWMAIAKKAESEVVPVLPLPETIDELSRDMQRRWLYRQGIKKKVEDAPKSKPEDFEPLDIYYDKSHFVGNPKDLFHIVKRVTKSHLTFFKGRFDEKYLTGSGTLNVAGVEAWVRDIGMRWFDADLTDGVLFTRRILMHPDKIAKHWRKCTKSLSAGEVAKMRADVIKLQHQLCNFKGVVGNTTLVQVYIEGTDPEHFQNLYILPSEFFGLVVAKQPSAGGKKAQPWTQRDKKTVRRWVGATPKEKKPTAAAKAAKVAMKDYVKRLKAQTPVLEPYLEGELLKHHDVDKIGIVNINYANGKVEITADIRASKGTVIPIFKVFERKSADKQLYHTLDHVALKRNVKLDDKVVLDPRKIARHWEKVTKDMAKGEVARLFELCKSKLHEVMFVRGRYLSVKKGWMEIAFGAECHLHGRGLRCDLPQAFLTPIKVVTPRIKIIKRTKK